MRAAGTRWATLPKLAKDRTKVLAKVLANSARGGFVVGAVGGRQCFED
jgi:hypothetical protein